MQKLLLFVDKISTWVGQAFSWFIVALTLHVSWEVFSRYVLDHPRAWAFDAMIMMYGTLFMMAGAYTLAKNGHVRGDVIYGFFTPRAQAALDLTLYIVFFIPGIVALVWAGYTYAAESWAINEHSNITSEGPPVYPFKTLIPPAGAFVLAHARADLRGHHARLSHGLHAHGNGSVLRLARLPQRGPGDRGPAGARSLRAAHLRHHVERRADRGAPVPVHGLSGRAGAADRPV